VAPDRHPRPRRRGDDRRGDAARPGPAGGRNQGEGPRGASSGHQADHPAGEEQEGPGGRAGAGEEGDGVHLRPFDGRRAAVGAGGGSVHQGGEEPAAGRGGAGRAEAAGAAGARVTSGKEKENENGKESDSPSRFSSRDRIRPSARSRRPSTTGVSD